MSSNRNWEITRRRFLSIAGGVAASALSSTAWCSSAFLPTGIQLYTVKDDLEKDPGGTLQKIAQIGYTEVESAGFAKLTAAKFRELVSAAGLRVPSAHVNFGMEETSKLLDDVTTVGAEYAVSSVLLAHPINPSEGVQGFIKALGAMTADDFKQVAATANELGAKAKAAGLQYAYHNHNFEFRDLGNGLTGYEILLHETDPSLVKFEADCGWMKVGGVDPVAYLTRHPNRFAMLHIKDFKNLSKPVTTLMGPDEPTPTEIGRGSIDSAPIIAAARKAEIKHVFVEQEPPFSEMSPLAAAAVDYTALHAMLVNP